MIVAGGGGPHHPPQDFGVAHLVQVTDRPVRLAAEVQLLVVRIDPGNDQVLVGRDRRRALCAGDLEVLGVEVAPAL